MKGIKSMFGPWWCGLRFYGLAVGVQSFRFGDSGREFRVEGLGFGIWSLRFGVWGLGVGV